MTFSPTPPPSDNPLPPWSRREFLGPAPTGGYGYLSEGVARACSLEELRQAVARGPEERVHFVWGPTTARLVPTAELPELFEALRGAQLARASEVLSSKMTWAAVSGVIVYLFGERLLGMPMSWLAMMWGAFFVLPMVDALVRRREWERATAGDAPALGEASRFLHWLAWRQTSKTTHVFIGVLVLTWLLSEAANLDRSIRLFAMDEAGVKAGAWWKLVTCFFLHGGIVHLVFNSMALSRLGQWVEGLTQAAWVPLILLLSTLGGSLAGFLLPPDVPSVGASGGVLGLLGFLLVFARHPGRAIPPAFQRLLWQWVAYVVLLGLIGWKVIDNAAHVGGLLTGAGLGAVANTLLAPTHPPVRAGWVPFVGWPAAAAFAAIAAWMISILARAAG
jgi:membrane associated rhomboid family serine protease